MSLRLKTILGIATIEAILLAILLSLTLNYLQQTNYEGLEQRASSTARLFATTVKNAVLSYDLATINAFTSELSNNPDILYVAVLGEDGQPLSQQGAVPVALSDDLLRLNTQLTKQDVYHIKADILAADMAFGAVWIGFDLSVLHQQISQAKRWSMLIVLGEMSLVALFSYVLGAYLTRRLSELKHAADAIARGERHIALSVTGEDELATVSQAFQNMVGKLRESEQQTHQYQQQLLVANESLEYKVATRTSDLLRSNRELRQTNDELKSTQAKLIEVEKMASIGTMAAGVAHEINNPIAAVKSNLQSCFDYLATYQQWVEQSDALLSHHPADSSALSHWKSAHHSEYLHQDFLDSLNDAQACVNRVANIVHALQHYSQRQNDQKRLFCSVELFTLLDKAVNQMTLPLNVQVTLDASVTKQPPLWGLGDELKTLFEQVIKNAVQACSRAAQPSHHAVSIFASSTPTDVTITIKDTGPGISAQQSLRIYDPFYTTLPVGEGMGLGLTYAYNIVRLHQGEIDIQSDTSGTTVSITLPVAMRSDPAVNNR